MESIRNFTEVYRVLDEVGIFDEEVLMTFTDDNVTSMKNELSKEIGTHSEILSLLDQEVSREVYTDPDFLNNFKTEGKKFIIDIEGIYYKARSIIKNNESGSLLVYKVKNVSYVLHIATTRFFEKDSFNNINALILEVLDPDSNENQMLKKESSKKHIRMIKETVKSVKNYTHANSFSKQRIIPYPQPKKYTKVWTGNLLVKNDCAEVNILLLRGEPFFAKTIMKAIGKDSRLRIKHHFVINEASQNLFTEDWVNSSCFLIMAAVPPNLQNDQKAYDTFRRIQCHFRESGGSGCVHPTLKLPKENNYVIYHILFINYADHYLKFLSPSERSLLASIKPDTFCLMVTLAEKLKDS